LRSLYAAFLLLPAAGAYMRARLYGLQSPIRTQTKGFGMRAFHLESGMKTLRGVFYPTGWMVLMFPSEQQAREAGRRLAGNGFAEEALMLVTPQDVRRELLETAGDEDILPSAGTEGDTVRRFAELAAQGHHGLMVHAPHQADSDRVMELLKDAPISYGQRYRTLVIEDLVV
jgi:hypothetical protein